MILILANYLQKPEQHPNESITQKQLYALLNIYFVGAYFPAVFLRRQQESSRLIV